MAVVEGVVKGFTKVEDKVSSALNDMKEYAANFTCEELLNPDVRIFIDLTKQTTSSSS